MTSIPVLEYTLLSFLCIFSFNSCLLFSQINHQKDIYISRFLPAQKARSIEKIHFSFPNINRLSYYHSEDKLSQIHYLNENKQWEEAYRVMYEYIDLFGIRNFLDKEDIHLLWIFARLTEYLNKIPITKEVYRLIIKHHRGDLQEALYHYDSLIKFEKFLYVELDHYYKLVERRKAIDTLRPPRGVLLNMGDLINSEYEDYAPVISGKYDDLILFSSERNRDIFSHNTHLGQNRHNEDIYQARKSRDNSWTRVTPFEKVNSPYNEGSPCISQDRKTLFFVRCNDPKGMGNCDIYRTDLLVSNHWSEAVNLGENVNSLMWDSHPSLSITGDTLYFSSDRKGGFGAADIYFSEKDNKGKWKKAQNLGPIVNTQKNEVSPHYHPKYNVLYFSSNGHLLNFGDFDIFKSYFINKTWTEPKNIGPLVNTPGREYYFSIDANSKYLYYSKTAEGRSDLDLYSFPLPMEAKPNNLVRFSGKAVELTTGEVFSGIVTIIDLDKNVEVAPKYLREDGSFDFDLIDNRRYLLVIEGDNFFRIEEIFFLQGNTEAKIPVQSVKGKITFESINFEIGSSKILPSMENNLHLITNFLLSHPNFHLKIIGHASSEGNKEFNKKLSEERSEEIKKYIIAYGNLSTKRVKVIGLGSENLLVEKEETEAHKRINRRVEFVFFIPSKILNY